MPAPAMLPHRQQATCRRRCRQLPRQGCASSSPMCGGGWARPWPRKWKVSAQDCRTACGRPWPRSLGRGSMPSSRGCGTASSVPCPHPVPPPGLPRPPQPCWLLCRQRPRPRRAAVLGAWRSCPETSSAASAFTCRWWSWAPCPLRAPAHGQRQHPRRSGPCSSTASAPPRPRCPAASGAAGSRGSRASCAVAPHRGSATTSCAQRLPSSDCLSSRRRSLWQTRTASRRAPELRTSCAAAPCGSRAEEAYRWHRRLSANCGWRIASSV
mmetsp:Transcript_26948/g.77323  ORF Transcript_26948/g.77323 Transcript_26948/m.77323 type:complete len:268 (+) Transcript_26948:72-875(+)